MQESDSISSINADDKVRFYLLARSMPAGIVSLIAVLITAAIFWDSTEHTHILYWTLSGVGIYLARLMISNTKKLERISNARTTAFFATLVLSGALWGVAGYHVLQEQTEVLRNGLLIWICCLCFLSTFIYAGKLSYFLAFTLPAIGIPITTIVNQATSDVSLMLYLLAGAGTYLVIISLIYRKSSLLGIASQVDHKQLKSEYSTLLEQAKKLEVSLKTSLQNNEELKAKLNKTSSTLTQCEKSKGTLASNLVTNIRTDPITNLSNRKEFLDKVSEEWQRSTRSKEPLTVAYINVDGFDQLVKTKDKTTIFSTLKKIGESIKSHGRRAGDVPARVDKSGFALLLLGADSKNAAKIIERVRCSISDKHISANNKGDEVSVHAGLATLVPSKESSPEELFKNVESAAYEAKFQGGDRVVSFHGFHDIPVTVWEPNKDGELNEANFKQKLLREGYNTKREVLPAQTTFKEQSFSKPMLFAVYSGVFVLTISGQKIELKRGSSIVMPENITFSAEVANEEPVILHLEIS